MDCGNTESMERDEMGPEKDPEERNRSLIPSHSATLHLLPGIALLKPKTNLNEPPTNWLSNNPKFHQNLYKFMWQRSHPMLSSIGMASHFPDLTGDIDVISNSKNIKKLLKMPFSGSHISMMVHRTGRTLLIDEFDIHKHLLRQQEDDWKWLRDFYFEYVKGSMQVKCVPKKNKTRDNLQSRNMLSKFLYRSIIEAQPDEEDKMRAMSLMQINDSAINRFQDTSQSEEGSSFHQREVLWKFEDLQMLIGTDLPILRRGSNCPCVSLRLRDMNTPINVLTGLDYWLDNLMCDVPEVAMCFHLNGIVQRYELIKTEEIPEMQGSQFNPEVVTDIARNILSFLKSNATKEGHTYWLYKGVDEDVVKLYDLTSLAKDSDVEDTANPFAVPLGMLLYTVARNMYQNPNKRKKATIKMLLETCLILLDQEKHAQVCTSARFLLADIFVPDGVLNDEESDIEDEEDDKEEEEEDENSHDDKGSWQEAKEENISTVKVQALCRKSNYHHYHEVSLLRLTQDLRDRCTEATHHTATGLQCLDRDFTVQIHKQKNLVEEQAQCYKDQAIPLHYEPLNMSAPPHDETDHPLHDKEQEQLAEPEPSRSWHRLLKVLLLRKATIAFCTVARKEMALKDVGSCLKNIDLALKCFAGIRTLLPKKAKENFEVLAAVLTIAGDAHMSFIQQNLKVSEIMSCLTNLSEDEINIIESVKREVDDFGYDWVLEMDINIGANLEKACQCYREAYHLMKNSSLKVAREGVVTLVKRYGNIKNELGVWYMNQAQQCLQQDSETFSKDKMEGLLKRSLVYLQEGVDLFDEISDSANMALLLSNKGRLMRLYAQIYTQGTLSSDNPEFSAQERLYYNKATESYQKALTCLGSKDKHRDIWDTVCWELSTTYFNMAMLLQDYAPLSKFSKDEVEKEVTDLMNRSLRYCNTENSGLHQPMYSYRAAMINHRLASLYHSSYREEKSEQRRKYLRQLAESHYRKASSQFQTLECQMELLRTRLELVALHEFSMSIQSSAKGRTRCLSQAISSLVSCSPVLTQMIKLSEDSEFREKLHIEGKDLTNILESRLKFLLLQLIKSYKEIKKGKNGDVDFPQVKQLYSDSLKPALKTEANDIIVIQCKWNWLISLLEKTKSLHKNIFLQDPG
ncbi:hypothetical protein FSP39_014975 [Pinctada imbricata]|uniref:Erythroid differentiation-related factor 1 n=1 Tax=Pinctada imbricata TaxID=66713 RepID=A0AA89BUW1_PINIB|nr:hypothetical protein FSP39_014975 [Pinctada imbricata]